MAVLTRLLQENEYDALVNSMVWIGEKPDWTFFLLLKVKMTNVSFKDKKTAKRLKEIADIAYPHGKKRPQHFNVLYERLEFIIEKNQEQKIFDRAHIVMI